MYRGLPFSTYAPRGGGGVKPPIHFHCVLRAKRGRGRPESMKHCVRTKWKAPYVIVSIESTPDVYDLNLTYLLLDR